MKKADLDLDTGHDYYPKLDWSKIHWTAIDYQVLRDRAQEQMDHAAKQGPNWGFERFTHIDDQLSDLLREQVAHMQDHFRRVMHTQIIWLNRDPNYVIPDKHKMFLTVLINEHEGNCEVIKDRTGLIMQDGKAIGWHLAERAIKEVVTKYPIVIHPDQFYNSFA